MSTENKSIHEFDFSLTRIIHAQQLSVNKICI